MSSPYTIVGHGLSGCVLAMTMYKKNIPFQLVGTSIPGEASMASSGIIAPVTGRRYVKTWNIEMYIDAALQFYRWSETIFGNTFFREIEIVRFLANEEAAKAWKHRLEDPEYRNYISSKSYEEIDQLQRPYGVLMGGYRLDTPGWLGAVREFLMDRGLMRIIDSPVSIKHDEENILILATGAVDKELAHGVIPNKGEALIVRLPEWKISLIVKDEVFIVPLYDDLFWVGSYYEPWPLDPYPSVEGKERLLLGISKLYNGPLEIIQHLAGVRPTVDDRRPIIGSFPGRSNVYLFNGMGTKATSLAPYWADQLIAHIDDRVSLPKEVSPGRYGAKF
jgi:glycine oxidase